MIRKHTPRVVGVLCLLALMSPAAHAKHWILLGTAHVDKSEDHKTIHVGSEAGSFHKIQLHVNGGAVEFQRVVVHFASGTQEELPVAERVRSGGKTREIELPGEHRAIDGVELWYSKENLDTRPEVSLYGTR
jgi:Protein of unknown function (DUF2541)